MSSQNNGVIKECSVCMDDCPDIPLIDVNQAYLCHECFIGRDGPKERLERALKFEDYFPASYPDHQLLDPAQYPAYFDAAWLARWEERKVECATPYLTRVYCKHQLLQGSNIPLTPQQIDVTSMNQRAECGKFLGAKRTVDESHRISIYVKICPTCDGLACETCSAPIWPEVIAPHQCVDSEPEDDFAIPDGWQLGRDFQKCPYCGRKIQLSDDGPYGRECNHMTCSLCKTEFCYVCGVQADGASGHWGYLEDGDVCPAYGQVLRTSGAPPVVNLEPEMLEEDNEDAELYDILNTDDGIVRTTPDLDFTLHHPAFDPSRFAVPDNFAGDRRTLIMVVELRRVYLNVRDNTPQDERPEWFFDYLDLVLELFSVIRRLQYAYYHADLSLAGIEIPFDDVSWAVRRCRIITSETAEFPEGVIDAERWVQHAVTHSLELVEKFRKFAEDNGIEIPEEEEDDAEAEGLGRNNEWMIDS